MNRDTFIALAQAWMRARGLTLARDSEHTGIATLHGPAEREALLDLTRVLDDAVRYGLEPALHPTAYASTPVPLPRTVTPDRAPTVQIPSDVLAAALARSR